MSTPGQPQRSFEVWLTAWTNALVERCRIRYGNVTFGDDESYVLDFLAKKGQRFWLEQAHDGRIVSSFNNFMIDVYRRRRSERRALERVAGRPPVALVQAPEDVVARPEAVEACNELDPEGRELVDRGAFLLLDLRAQAAIAFAKAVRRGRAAGSPSRFAEEMFPWPADEGLRRAHPTEPEIGVLWARLAAAIDAMVEERCPSMQVLAAAIGISAANWYQRAKRAKNAMELKIGPEYFGQLFDLRKRKSR